MPERLIGDKTTVAASRNRLGFMQELVPGLSLENVLDGTAADDSIPFVADGSSGEDRPDSFPRSPAESVDNESCHISGNVACPCHQQAVSFDAEYERIEPQHHSSSRPYRQVLMLDHHVHRNWCIPEQFSITLRWELRSCLG